MMGRKVLSYPSLGETPILFVQIVHPETGQARIFQMLVDTGATKTCLPAHFAASFGHDNRHPLVKKTIAHGLGDSSQAFVHTLKVALIDPEATEQEKLRTFWTSPVMPVLFAEKMTTKFGLLGRDVLAQWQQICFRPMAGNPAPFWTIEITL